MTNGNMALALHRETAALAVPSQRAFEPQSFDGAIAMCRTLFASRLLPKHIQSVEAAVTIVAAGRELGFSTMVSLRSIWIVDGKITLSADLMVACVKRAPQCEWFRLVESTATSATYATKHRDNPEQTRMSFTIEDAQRAGIAGKDVWRKYPAAMLRARCSSALARAEYPDAVAGVYDAEELEPAPTKIDVEVVTPDGEVVSGPRVEPAEASEHGREALRAIDALESYKGSVALYKRIEKDARLTNELRALLLTQCKKRGLDLKASEGAPAPPPGVTYNASWQQAEPPPSSEEMAPSDDPDSERNP